MRILRDISNRQYTQVICLDDPGAGNACHKYQVLLAGSGQPAVPFAVVNFQNGPIKENEVNGCGNEDLIAIVIDRLQGFQSGAFNCRENAIALTKLEEALLWLNYRTNKRIARGVEGKNVV
jgi:hypothetical protein